MKKSMVLALVALVLGVNASAAELEKICKGQPKTEGAREVFIMKVSGAAITLKSQSNYVMFDATYARVTSKVGNTNVVENGITFLQYNGEDDGYFNEFKMEQSLLTYGTSGIIKVVSHMEGDSELTFNCSDRK